MLELFPDTLVHTTTLTQSCADQMSFQKLSSAKATLPASTTDKFTTTL